MDETLYALLRLGLSVESMVMASILFFQSIPRVREAAPEPRVRLRMITIVFALFGVTMLLGVTAVYDWDRPPPTDGVLAFFGVAVRAFVAYVTTVLVVTKPADDETGVAIARRYVKPFTDWLELHDPGSPEIKALRDTIAKNERRDPDFYKTRE